MRHLMPLAFTWSILALGIAHAHPARPLYEPQEPPKLPARVAIDLKGSAWLGKYNAVARIFILEADGTLSYKSTTAKGKAKVFKGRGSWRVEGDTLIFEHFVNPNQKLMEFRGAIKDGNTIFGEATYFLLNGNKATQTMQRTEVP